MNFAEFVQQECPTLIDLPHGLTMAELEAEAGKDLKWQDMRKDTRWLRHLAENLHARRLRERGEVPPSYTAIRECSGCGPVLLESWTPERVEGCPWCLNRGVGLPVPRPGVSHG